MAAVLEVHYADIRVVGVFQGSTVVEFEVVQGEDAEEESWFEEVGQKFETAFSNLVDFMGTPVLSAAKDGQYVETPTGKAQAGDEDQFKFTFDDEPVEEGEGEDEGPEVVTEIVYRQSESDTVASDAPGGSFTYGMLLGILISLLAVVLAGVCLYNKLRPSRDKVVKEVTDRSPLEQVKAQRGALAA